MSHLPQHVQTVLHKTTTYCKILHDCTLCFPKTYMSIVAVQKRQQNEFKQKNKFMHVKIERNHLINKLDSSLPIFEEMSEAKGGRGECTERDVTLYISDDVTARWLSTL